MTGWTIDDLPDQTGRIAVVTGANSGLGLEVARALAARGARVVLACRSLDRAEVARADIGRSAAGDVDVLQLDLADLGSVERFTAAYGTKYDRLDLLVNNAGLMAIDESRTTDGFETQLGVNHLGHFALTARLLPLLLDTPRSRIATVSSMGHRAGRLALDDLMFERRGYRRWAAYFQSKLANLLFTAELQRRLRASGTETIAVAAHPGGSRTDLGTEGAALTNRAMAKVVPLVTQPAAAGALPILRAATDPSAEGGHFYGPRFVVRGRRAVAETPSRRARDASSATGLWHASEQLVGFVPEFG
ncbi:MAG: oxidoreductase [Nocardioides sp.]